MATSPFFVKSKLKVKNTSADTYAATVENATFGGDKTFILPAVTAASVTVAQITETQTLAGLQTFGDKIKVKNLTADTYGATVQNETLTADRVVKHQDRSGTFADLQNIQDAAADKPSYYLNGSSYVSTLASANLALGLGDFTMIWEGMITQQSVDTRYLLQNFAGANGVALQVTNTSVLRVQLGGSTASTSITVPVEQYASIIVIRQNGVIYPYLNGVLGTFPGLAATDISGTPVFTTGYPAANVNIVGHIYRAGLLNYAAFTKVQRYSAGAKLDWEDVGGSMTQQTSGTLTIGKRYRTVDWITDDDFTNVSSTGASANVDGAEWTCIATTPTKWTNASKLIPLGCVLGLEPEGIGEGTWQDSSTNKLHGTVTNALAQFPSQNDPATTWLPAITAGTNVAAVGTASGAKYRVANGICHFEFNATIDVTAAGPTASTVTFTLPIAAKTTNINGVISSATNIGRITAAAAAATASWYCTNDTANVAHVISGSYFI
jgi:hypothetical protein